MPAWLLCSKRMVSNGKFRSNPRHMLQLLEAEASSGCPDKSFSSLSTGDKVALFRRLFRGRTDVYPSGGNRSYLLCQEYVRFRFSLLPVQHGKGCNAQHLPLLLQEAQLQPPSLGVLTQVEAQNQKASSMG